MFRLSSPPGASAASAMVNGACCPGHPQTKAPGNTETGRGALDRPSGKRRLGQQLPQPQQPMLWKAQSHAAEGGAAAGTGAGTFAGAGADADAQAGALAGADAGAGAALTGPGRFVWTTCWTEEAHKNFLDLIEADFVRRMYSRQYCHADICGVNDAGTGGGCGGGECLVAQKPRGGGEIGGGSSRAAVAAPFEAPQTSQTSQSGSGGGGAGLPEVACAGVGSKRRRHGEEGSHSWREATGDAAATAATAATAARIGTSCAAESADVTMSVACSSSASGTCATGSSEADNSGDGISDDATGGRSSVDWDCDSEDFTAVLRGYGEEGEENASSCDSVCGGGEEVEQRVRVSGLTPVPAPPPAMAAAAAAVAAPAAANAELAAYGDAGEESEEAMGEGMGESGDERVCECRFEGAEEAVTAAVAAHMLSRPNVLPFAAAAPSAPSALLAPLAPLAPAAPSAPCCHCLLPAAPLTAYHPAASPSALTPSFASSLPASMSASPLLSVSAVMAPAAAAAAAAATPAPSPPLLAPLPLFPTHAPFRSPWIRRFNHYQQTLSLSPAPAAAAAPAPAAAAAAAASCFSFLAPLEAEAGRLAAASVAAAAAAAAAKTAAAAAAAAAAEAAAAAAEAAAAAAQKGGVSTTCTSNTSISPRPDTLHIGTITTITEIGHRLAGNSFESTC